MLNHLIKISITFVFLLAGIHATAQEADAVHALRKKYETDFNAYKTQNGTFNNTALDWIAFFTQKSIKDIEFTAQHKATIRAILERGVGFGGINYKRFARDYKRGTSSGDKPYILGLQLVYQTCQPDEITLAPVAEAAFRSSELKFHQLLGQLQRDCCFVPITSRLQNIDKLRNPDGSAAFDATMGDATYTVALPIFVSKDGKLYVVASKDWMPNYSIGYGGKIDRTDSALHTFVKELNEELWSGGPLKPEVIDKYVIGKYYREIAAKELSVFSQQPLLDSQNIKRENKRIAVGRCVTTATYFVSRVQGQSKISGVEGVVFLPLETLDIQTADPNQELPIDILKDLRKAATSGCCRERSGFTLISLDRYLTETKDDHLPIGRVFDSKTYKVAFDGNIVIGSPISQIFQLMGREAPVYRRKVATP